MCCSRPERSIEKSSALFLQDDILNKFENRNIRKSTGQLNWLSSQTRPDLAFDSVKLSVCLNKATNRDARYSRKVVKRAKEENYQIKFSHLGPIEKLHIQVFADASLGNIEYNLETKSVMGSFICIANDKFKSSPLSWKSKIIEKVANDIKTAETLSLESAVDNAVYLSSMIKEVYSENKLELPIVVNEDSKCLVESLYSTKKVKKKTMRLVISSLQQYMKNGTIKQINHVSSKDQLGDVLTKKGVLADKIIYAVSKGSLVYEEEDDYKTEETKDCEKYSLIDNTNEDNRFSDGDMIVDNTEVDEGETHSSTIDESREKVDNVQEKPFWKRIWRKFDNVF